MRYSKQATAVMTIQLPDSGNFLALKIHNNVEIRCFFEHGLKLLNYTAADALQIDAA
jgi:hypothetical protein